MPEGPGGPGEFERVHVAAGERRQRDIIAVQRAALAGDDIQHGRKVLRGALGGEQAVEAEFTIQSIVGERPATFAYPFGDWNPGVVSGVARAGFDAAVINLEVGPVDWTNRFLIPRLEVGPTTTPAQLVAEADSAAPPRT